MDVERIGVDVGKVVAAVVTKNIEFSTRVALLIIYPGRLSVLRTLLWCPNDCIFELRSIIVTSFANTPQDTSLTAWLYLLVLVVELS